MSLCYIYFYYTYINTYFYGLDVLIYEIVPIFNWFYICFYLIWQYISYVEM